MVSSTISMDVIQKDLPDALNMLEKLPNSIHETNKFFKSLIQKVNSEDFNISDGIGFLTVKCNILLNYITDLSLLLLEKAEGNTLQKNEAVQRLVENRIVWEKILPIDNKLKYQIDKVVQSAVTGKGVADALEYRAKPENLIPKLEDEDDDENNPEETGHHNIKPYVPPKLAAVQCGQMTAEERREKLIERAKKRALGSTLLQDLKREYDEGPEEYMESNSLHRIKENKEAKERIRYEEENFVRLPISKKEKMASRRLTTSASLGQLANFENINVLYDENDFHLDEPSKKKKKMKGKGKKKGFKKKRKL
ncbi:neuroguidin [Octopus bimaculoides]|uniref:Sas10 C-terminal domain-containing protein n=1 Tax=Octopus bimaculoides TaxID=37653 RepID=A0A0L8G0Y7_OCTBM|nr:neuroguidin [Octopus bimaculoides]